MVRLTYFAWIQEGRNGRPNRVDGREMTDSDDDMPVLSDYAQQALQQFLAEQQAAAQIEQEMLEQGEDDKKAEVELKEDWQLRNLGYFTKLWLHKFSLPSIRT